MFANLSGCYEQPSFNPACITFLSFGRSIINSFRLEVIEARIISSILDQFFIHLQKIMKSLWSQIYFFYSFNSLLYQKFPTHS